MSVILSDDLLQTIQMSEDEIRLEIAVLLYQREKLTLAQAARFCGLNRIQFQHVLASRKIPIHYDINDFEEDLRSFREIKEL